MTLSERLLVKLKKLGMPERKAKEVAKKLVPTASKAPVKGTVTEKLVARLIKLGLSERKAKELAKGLAPMVRSAIKSKVKAHAKTLDDVTDDQVEDAVADATDKAEDAELDKVAPRVNGHRVRLDLPVVSRASWMHEPVKGIELLRVMDGLSTTGTYLVASVRKDQGIVAVRQLGQDLYNVKFYPTMAYWGKTEAELSSLGAVDYLAREWYQRMHFSQRSLDQFLRRLEVEAKPKSRMKALMDRFTTVTAAPLIKAFDYLHKRIGRAA